MGIEIAKNTFTEEDFNLFSENLKRETDTIQRWEGNKSFSFEGASAGIELEGYLVNKKMQPSLINEVFLDSVKSQQIVPELGRFTFEINGSPHSCNPDILKNLKNELDDLITRCRTHANNFSSNCVMIGILPTLENKVLTLKSMTPLKRYLALNDQVFKQLDSKHINVHISGRDVLKIRKYNVMLASAPTSFQFQLKVPYKEIIKTFNLSQMFSSALVALSANSPYLFGKELWDESRVPLFEHAINSAPTRRKAMHSPRAIFGTGYIETAKDYFDANVNQFPILLPYNFDEANRELPHLSLHNGTIWRWNRLVLGYTNKVPHLRVEHRSMPSGPTLDDMMANFAYYLGIMTYYNQRDTLELIPYECTKNNFYDSAKFGLKASVEWAGEKVIPLKELLLHTLPKARDGLHSLGISCDESEYYLDYIIKGRVQSFMNGAEWQKQFYKNNGNNFKKLTETYIENQETNKPVHLWSL